MKFPKSACQELSSPLVHPSPDKRKRVLSPHSQDPITGAHFYFPLIVKKLEKLAKERAASNALPEIGAKLGKERIADKWKKLMNVFESVSIKNVAMRNVKVEETKGKSETLKSPPARNWKPSLASYTRTNPSVTGYYYPGKYILKKDEEMPINPATHTRKTTYCSSKSSAKLKLIRSCENLAEVLKTPQTKAKSGPVSSVKKKQSTVIINPARIGLFNTYYSMTKPKQLTGISKGKTINNKKAFRVSSSSIDFINTIKAAGTKYKLIGRHYSGLSTIINKL